MKTQLFPLALLLGLFALLLLPARLQAQDGDGGGGGAGGGGRLSFLSADDRAHLFKVRQEVLSTHPDLKAEQDSLNKEREYVKNKGSDASDDDHKTLWENMRAHGEKMEAAMKATDPTVAPILDQVNAKMKERFKQHAAQSGGGDDTPTN